MRNVFVSPIASVVLVILSLWSSDVLAQGQDWGALGIEFGQYLIQDDFEGPRRAAGLNMGAAHIEDIALGSVAVFPGENAGTGLIAGGWQVEDYLLTFRIHRIVGACTIRFRYLDGQYYYLVLSPNLVLYKEHGDGLGAEPLARAFCPLTWNQWQDVAILAIGCSIRVWIDGELYIDHVDDTRVPFLAGGIEFSSDYSLQAARRFLVDDLVIREAKSAAVPTSCHATAAAAPSPSGEYLPKSVGQLVSARDILLEESFEGEDLPEWAVHEACSLSKYLPFGGGRQYDGTNTWLRVMSDVCSLRLGSEDWSDYLVSVRVVPSHGRFTVVFRDSATGSYCVTLDWDEATLSLRKRAGLDDTILSLVPVRAVELRHGILLAIGGYGSHIGVYLDRTLVMEVEDSLAPLLSGVAGIETAKSRPPYVAQAAVDDVAVYEIGFGPELDIRTSGTEMASYGQDTTVFVTISHSAASDGSAVSDVDVVDSLTGAAEIVTKSGGDDDLFLEGGETWRYRTSYAIQRDDPSPLEREICVSGLTRSGEAVQWCASHSIVVKYNPVLMATLLAPDSATVGDTVTYGIAVSQSPEGSGAPISHLQLSAGSAVPVELIAKTGGDQDELLEDDEIWTYEIYHTVTMEDDSPLMLDVEVQGLSPDGDTIQCGVTHALEVGLPLMPSLETWPLLLEEGFDDQVGAASLIQSLPAGGYRFEEQGGLDVLTLTCNCWLNVQRCDRSWTDYAFVTRLAVLHASLTLSFRMCDAGRYYVEIDPRDGASGVVLLGEEMAEQPRRQLESVAIALGYGTWHEVVVLGIGATLQVFLDGELLLHHVDESDPLPFGGVGYEMCGESPQVLIDFLRTLRYTEGG